MRKRRLLRITTVPLSLVTLLKGQPQFFQQNDFEVLTVSAEGNEIEQLNAAGVPHQSVLLTRKITPFRDLFAVIQLILIILRFKPDIVHTHTPKAGLLGMLAAWICRAPIRVHTIAGLTWINDSGFKRWILRKIEWTTYAMASRVYPNSNNLREFLLTELKFSPTKTMVIGKGSSNGIDVEYFKPDQDLTKRALDLRKKNRIPDHEIVFSFVGRVVSDKGIVDLLEAFENLSKYRPCWLLVVGDFEPELDPLPENALTSLRNNPRIVLAGFQQDVRPWLLASDVFVLPSHREGFPNVVMQACCLELPVIASNINGCNEIIEHDQTGLLVPIKDVAALHAAMANLSAEGNTRKQFGIRGREFVVKKFDQQTVWQNWLKEYIGLMP